MPLTPQQKAELLNKHGVDSTKYWLDDAGNIVDLPTDNSVLSGAKSALYNAPRTALGFGGGAAGAAGAGALGIPTGPGAIAAGIGGAVVGSGIGAAIGDKLQESLYPQDWQLGQEARAARQPGATRVADIASQLAFMRPSPAVMRDAARGVRAFTTQPGFVAMRPAQVSALGNIGIGAGLGAGQAIASGGGVGDVLTETAIGALLHEPTRLGRMASMGTFTPHVPDVGLRDAVDPATLRAPTEAPAEPTVDMSRNEALLKAYMKSQKQNASLAEQIAKMSANDAALAKQREVEAAIAKPERVAIDDEGALEAQLEPAPATIPRNVDPLEARLAAASKPTEVVGDTTAEGIIAEDPAGLRLKVDDTKPQPKPPVIAEPGTPGALDQELGIRVTKPFFDWWANNAKENYRTQMESSPVYNEEGKPVAGATEGVRRPTGERRMAVDPNAYTDTAPHELTHGMILDVLQHGKKGEQAEMRRLLKAAGVEEEAFVQGVGEDVVRRFMGDIDQSRKTASGETSKRYKVDDSWRSDFVSLMKYKFGKASPEDARRIMSNVMLRGGGPKGVVRIQAKPPMQTEEKVEQPTVEQPAQEPIVEPQVPEQEMGYTPTITKRGPDYSAIEPEIKAFDTAKEAAEVLKSSTDITRPETREYSGESIPANIRRGRANATNERESAADLEARRIEARLAGEERPRYQEFGPDREGQDYSTIPFSTDLQKELAKPRPFNVQVGKDNSISRADAYSIRAKLPPAEREMADAAGFEEFIASKAKHTKEEIAKWADENLPKVEVRRLWATGNPQSKAEADYMQMRHEWFDNLSQDEQALVRNYVINGDPLPAMAPPDLREQAQRYRRLFEIAEGSRKPDAQPENDSATRAYTQVNPRDLKDMPGAVDLLVRMPRRARDTNKVVYGDSRDAQTVESPLYEASNSHYSQSGDNLLTHVRAYEHTMPDGRKVLRVFEIQSDWAQQRNKAEKSWEKRIEQDVNGKFKIRTAVGTAPDMAHARFDTKEAALEYMSQQYKDVVAAHTLLAHTNRLGIKAAIEHARERGLDGVVFDDAETAMLSQGHDRAHGLSRVTVSTAKKYAERDGRQPHYMWGKDYANGTYVSDRGTIMRVDVPERNYKTVGEVPDMARIARAKELQAYGMGNDEAAISQAGGMRFNYDQDVQRAARDITGNQGEKVELGEHKNALELRQMDSEGEKREGLRQDLIFKNPDGTPKTTSTGTYYPLGVAGARRQTGEPFTVSGRKYQEFGPNRPTSGLAETEGRMDFSPFESASQKLAKSSNPVARTVGRALSELYPAQRAMQGKYRALSESFADLSEKDKDTLYRILIDEYRSGTPMPSTVPARLRKEYNDIRKTLRQMRDDQIAVGQRNTNGAIPKVDPTYFPNVVDPSVRKTMIDEIDSPRYNQLRDEFIQFNEANLRAKGQNAADAKKNAEGYFNRFIGTLDKQPIKGAFDFGAVTLPEGSRLPDNWLHSDPAEAMRQYVRDWSRARTFYDVVQTKDDVMAGLGAEEFYVNGKKTKVTNRVTPVIKDSNVLYLLNEALGIRRRSADNITGAVGRAASGLWLANPVTRTVDIATSLFKSLGMVKPSEIPGLVANIRDLGQSIERAHDTGWIKEDGNTIVGEVLGAGEAFTNGVDKFTKGLSKYTGSEKLENFGRGLAQNLGEYIARTNTALAQSGNKKAVAFLDRVAPNWRTLSEAELGTRIGQLFQGRYDATNLPRWMSDSPAAPFFSLARWNIEQWNNFREFAVEPAKKGDYAPMVSMLLAGLVGGIGVKEIREAMTGRESKIATIKEIVEAPEGSAKYKEGVRYLGNLAQLSGTMGIVSEMANWGLDLASKDMPAAATMPALEVTKDVIPRLVAGANAIMDGQDPLTVIAQVGKDLGNEHVSAYRFIENNLGRTGVWDEAGEDLKDANARRDLRVGKRLRGEPIKGAVQMPIDYSRAEERAVERERDPAEMRAKARELKKDIMAEPDKDTRERRMRSAAASRPSYMPSKDNDPKAFREQLDFVRRTQGEDKANELRRRYLRDKRNADVRRGMFN